MLAANRFWPDGTGTDLGIGVVFARWIATREVAPKTLEGYRDSVRRFLTWCESKDLARWADLRHEHAELYLKELRGAGYKQGYISHRMNVVRGCSRWAAHNWEGAFRDFAAGLRIKKRARGGLYETAEDRKALSLGELCDLVRFILQDNPGFPFLAVGVALQGFMGLRLTETLNLTADKIDLEAGTLTLEGELKNHESIRRLPIPPTLIPFLKTLISTEGSVIPYADRHTYSQRLAWAIRSWKPGATVRPMDLRKTLPSEAIAGGWFGYEVRRFLGHAPADITERHYILQNQAQLLELLRQRVSSRIEAEIEKSGVFQQRFSNAGKIVALRKGS